MKKIWVYISIFLAFPAFSQEGDSLKLTPLQDGMDTIDEESNTSEFKSLKDTSIPLSTIDLEEVLVLGELRFDNAAERQRYLILQRKTRKVWPYATLTAERLTELNRRLATLDSKAAKRRYVKIIQRYIEDEFTAELKKLTKTEGQILVKLIYRQTGTTTYDMVRDLKSGWRAFWYNTTASLFNISLKEEYLPATVEEDFLIEDILQRSFRKGIIERQEPAVEIDYLYLLNKWSGEN